MTRRIDAHQHYWRYNPDDYAWIDDKMNAIRRDFLPTDLQRELAATLVTEADYETWTVEQLRPYLDAVLVAFGAGRLMFGSDWPVCLVACSYTRWHRIVSDFVARLSRDEQAAIMGRNAAAAYRVQIEVHAETAATA
jgi:predicted TIM-barrel fold metal-dependent hydrolase